MNPAFLEAMMGFPLQWTNAACPLSWREFPNNPFAVTP